MRRACLLLLALALGSAACADGDGLPRGAIVIEGQRIEVEIAHTSKAREQGLSGRAGLPPGTGLLFLHPKPKELHYWMKDMRFDIDIVWMLEGRVIGVSHEVPAPGPGEDGRKTVVGPGGLGDSALELPAGTARALGIAAGQRVTLDIPTLD